MNLLRNREVKIYSLIYWFLSAIFVVVTLFINLTCAVIMFLMCLLFYALFLLLLKTRYDKIKSLSLEIDEILHGKKNVKISENKEGELSILENEIEKLFMMLQIQNEKLEKERNFLSDSIADISHQLRTPLTSINIIITLLRSENIDKKQRFEFLNRLTRLVDRTDKLITTLLKLSKIDAGTVKFDAKKVSVKELVEKAFEPLSAMFDIKEQNFCVEVSDEAYVGDISWSVEALSNIIKNCSEHTSPNGTVTVRANQTPIYCEIVVEDDGEGFSTQDLPYIFERFYKGKNSSKDSFGIGLALAKAIVISQDGTIKAMNTEKGAAFVIRFYSSTV